MHGAELAHAKSFFTEHSDSAKQTDAGLDGSEPCKPFTIKITNILQINVNGEEYKVL